MTRRILFVVVAIAAAVLVLGLRSGLVGVASTDYVAIESISGPALVPAGGSIDLEVATVADGRVALMVITSAKDVLLETDASDGIAVVALAPPLTNISGAVSIVPVTTTSAEVHEVQVVPDRAVASIELVVGARTLQLGQQAMAVVVVADSFGNPAADGTAVQVSVVDISGSTTTMQRSTENGRVAVDLPAAPGPGRETVAARSGEVVSSAATVTTLAGAPVVPELLLRADDMPLVADGSLRLVLSSEPVVDQSGAPLPDGMITTLMIDGPEGAGLVTGQIRSNRIEAVLLAPNRPGAMSITPVISGESGQPLVLEFVPAVQPFTFRFDGPSDARVVEIGPVVAWHGALVPDGTEAVVNGRKYPLIAGMARVDDIGDFTTLAGLDIEVLGISGSSQ